MSISGIKYSTQNNNFFLKKNSLSKINPWSFAFAMVQLSIFSFCCLLFSYGGSETGFSVKREFFGCKNRSRLSRIHCIEPMIEIKAKETTIGKHRESEMDREAGV